MKILVIRFSSIGDVVLTTPVLRGLKEQIKDAEVHFLTKKAFLPIVQNNPRLDKVYTIEKHINEVIKELKNEDYDFILDLHNNLRTKSVKLKLRKPSQSFSKLNWKKWLLVRFKLNRMPKIHIVERYFDTAKKIGVLNDHLPCEYYVSKNDKVDIKNEFQLDPKGYITIAIGAQFATKKMPKSLLIEVINQIKQPVVLIGGPTDVTLAKELMNEVAETQLFNGCGKYSLNQSASIVEQSNGIISNDTGMMHIASCFNLKIVSVWGNTVPDLGMFPYSPKDKNYSVHQVDGLSCRPCSKIGFKECPKGHFKCMNNQNANEIVSGLL